PLSTCCHAARQIFAGDALAGSLEVRHRRTGDRFRPLGMKGSKKLKDVFNDLGLTRPERDRQLLVVSGDTIIWLVGHNIDRDVAVNGSTRNLVEITIE